MMQVDREELWRADPDTMPHCSGEDRMEGPIVLPNESGVGFWPGARLLGISS